MIISLGIGAVRLERIAAFCGALPPRERACVTPARLVTDSREILPGDLFIALHGKDDGHLYTKEAAHRGAVAVIAEKKTDADIPHIIVQSAKRALGEWARSVLKETNAYRIGITGSVGKSTAKDAIAAMLSTRFSVHATYQNFNNDLGLPFTILETPKETRILICEMGISHIGEMRPLSRILMPHISLITCIGHAHIGAFGTRDAIAEEKADILAFAEPNGLFIVPQNEKLLSFVPPNGIQRMPVLPFAEKEIEEHRLPIVKEDLPRAFSLAYALAIAKAFSLTNEEIAEGFRRILAHNTHKSEELCGDILLIDDTYNASPEAMLGALTYLSAKKENRRVAVLGDMLELGDESARFHRAIGRFAAQKADLLFFFGKSASEYARGAKAAGAVPLSDLNVKEPVFSVLEGDTEEMAKRITQNLKKGDVVLFKAARAMAAENLVATCKKRIFFEPR